MSEAAVPEISGAVRALFEPIVKALGPARQALAKVADVIAVRPGYDYTVASAPVPAVVVAIRPGTESLDAAGLARQLGVPVSVTDASVDEQIAAIQRDEGPMAFGVLSAALTSPLETLLIGEEPVEFALPKTGVYEPLDPPQLPLVDEKMKLTVCVSPEAGWSELESFLASTEERLTVAMYQFTAPHIFEAVRAAVVPEGRRLELVLHPIPEKPAKSGVKAHDLDEEKKVIAPLEKKMGDRFQMSWATLVSKAHPDGQWASAYHIKVAVRDGKTFWLSSGNWQSSNQPDVHPFNDPPGPLPPGFQRKYNRDYHAIIENDTLSSAYETYIKRDYELTAAAAEPESFALPDLFVPEEEEAIEFAEPPQFFQPLRLERRLKVQPLLTPDNYAENALKLIQSAKQSVLFQNQYILSRSGLRIRLGAAGHGEADPAACSSRPRRREDSARFQTGPVFRGLRRLSPTLKIVRRAARKHYKFAHHVDGNQIGTAGGFYGTKSSGNRRWRERGKSLEREQHGAPGTAQ
ncbi:MAG TPA: hypothetical protein VKM54_00685 [Myxococcota bacterium]|nr:hypothetical protein [Myxococcota bacterium]